MHWQLNKLYKSGLYEYILKYILLCSIYVCVYIYIYCSPLLMITQGCIVISYSSLVLFCFNFSLNFILTSSMYRAQWTSASSKVNICDLAGILPSIEVTDFM
ncbi:hypothetical protein GDO81_016975 [Engystomops pustulosus]|uniref:Uncharacterized protein n=1 Tax=Engystomops pustulosus TaxID=76066 RepID=A0AAV7AAM1_ENGPU|nr:hypothetical protein GDO81_016975 [Engystomops pustulosus]